MAINRTVTRRLGEKGKRDLGYGVKDVGGEAGT